MDEAEVPPPSSAALPTRLAESPGARGTEITIYQNADGPVSLGAVLSEHDQTIALIEHINALPDRDRKGAKIRLRGLARDFDNQAKENGRRANIAFIVGGTIGGGLLTSGIILLATVPVAFITALPAVAGAAVLITGIASGSSHHSRQNTQDKISQTCKDIADEIS